MWVVYIFVLVQCVVLTKGNIFSSEVSSVQVSLKHIYTQRRTTTRLFVYCVSSLSKIYYSVNHGEHPLALCRERAVIVITGIQAAAQGGTSTEKQPFLLTVIRRGNTSSNYILKAHESVERIYCAGYCCALVRRRY